MEQTQNAPAKAGRKLRSLNRSLKVAYDALGIEDDDLSDKDFEPGDDLDDEDEDEGVSTTKTHEDSARNSASKRRPLNNQTIKLSDSKTPLKRHSPHGCSQPHFEKRKVLKVSKLGGDDCSGSEQSNGPSSVPEYEPRHRASKHLEELEAMNPGDDEIENVVPAFSPPVGITSWEEFNKLFDSYKKQNKLKFRVRSSDKTALYNSTHEDQIPTTFEWYQKIYRCTHGVTQASRSKGHRNRKTRYCKCKARLTAVVTRVEDNTFNIVVRNENHTHSHPTTRTEVASYLTTKTIPLDDEDREDVKTLIDARVSSSHITNFLNDRIGCQVTPQQTRNLIRSIIGQDSAEDTLKDLLHSLRQIDGSDVMVMQDQMDTTCGVVMQTKLQKIMFEQWGENLTMDFTHGTNNLGFHLGSLVVTTCTGRGFPVFDFICLNEYAVTMKSVLEYFKTHNPKWKDVESVVIDKDFVEWQVLKECFPAAQVLFCQFHAISYWKKVMRRPVYRIKVAEGETLLDMMMKLLYSQTLAAYENRYKDLKTFCRDSKNQAFLAYFDKNWETCRNMWSNYARGKHFTAGNTTTNRIESNWKYLKMLLGRKTRIDKTVAGLLQHQIIITRQIVAEIGKLHSTSRAPSTVPKFLRAVARRLSSHVLDKVKSEWEKFVNREEDTNCERESAVTEWKVSYSHQQYKCDDVDWTCDCLFYSSNRLPCCHLMHVANRGHGFSTLPGLSIRKRWSTFEALDLKEDLASAADSLQPIVNMSKLKLPKGNLRLPEEKDENSRKRSTRTCASGDNQVVLVRLRRHERANQVVLSSGEKYSYAKALLEPLLEHLSELSSADYYQQLRAWKETIEIGLRGATGSHPAPGGNEVRDDEEVDADVFSMSDLADAMGTASLMEEHEHEAIVTDESGDDDLLPPTQPTIDPEAGALLEQDLKSGDGPNDKDTASSEVMSEPAPRQVDVVSIPRPKSRGRARTTVKQLRQSKISPGAYRLAVHKYPSNLAVQLDDFVLWARNTVNMKSVAAMIEKYPIQLEDPYLRSRAIQCGWEAFRPATYMHPFVIPADLTRSMEAALKTARTEQLEPDPLTESISKQGIVLDLVLTIDPKLWKFSGKYVGALRTFYDVKRSTRAWFEDIKWLQKDWRKIVCAVTLFETETGTGGMAAEAACLRHWSMANEVISKFTSSRMSSEFMTASGKGLVTFANVVGGLCRGWLNDSPLDFCMEALAAVAENCYVLSSLTSAVGWPTIPAKPIITAKFILHPVNLSSSHWGIIIVRLLYCDAEDTLKVHLYLYEPLIDDVYHPEMEQEWDGIADAEGNVVKEGLRGFVERWSQASAPSTKMFIQPIEWVNSPQQPDSESCGVFVVAQAYSYITENLDWQLCSISNNAVQVMRLRMLWMILCNSRESRIARGTADKVKAIHAKLVDELK